MMRKVVNAYRNLLREKGEMDSSLSPSLSIHFYFYFKAYFDTGWSVASVSAMIGNLPLLSEVGNVTTAVQEKNPVF